MVKRELGIDAAVFSCHFGEFFSVDVEVVVGEPVWVLAWIVLVLRHVIHIDRLCVGGLEVLDVNHVAVDPCTHRLVCAIENLTCRARLVPEACLVHHDLDVVG